MVMGTRRARRTKKMRYRRINYIEGYDVVRFWNLVVPAVLVWLCLWSVVV
jgi:ribosomal protein L4